MPAFIQPSDETPLPGNTTKPPAVVAAVPQIAAQVAADRSGVVSAAQEAMGGLQQQIATDYLDAVAAAAGATQEAKNALSAAIVPVYKATGKLMSSVQSTIRDGETTLWQAGVTTPLSMTERAADLEDLTGGKLIGRLAGAGGTPTPKQPELDGTAPVDGTCVEWTVPTSNPATGSLKCPPGYKLVSTTWGGMQCRFDAADPIWIGTACDPNASPPPSPPTSPPPAPEPEPEPIATNPVLPNPPTVPPVVAGPPSGDCADPKPATLVKCWEPTLPPLPVQYWLYIDCKNPCHPKACVYSGQIPPINPIGVLAGGPWSTMPSDATIDALAAITCPAYTSPPTSPPSPPTAPPAPVAPPTAPPTTPPPKPPPVPKPPTSPPAGIEPVDGEVKWVDWSLSTACDAALQITSDISRITNPNGTPSEGRTVTSWFGIESWTDLFPVLNYPIAGVGIIGKLTGADFKESGLLHQAGLDTLGTALSDQFVKMMGEQGIKNVDAAVGLGSYLALADRAQHLSGFPCTYLSTPVLYTFQYANPMFIPSQAELDTAFLTNQINAGLWECLTKANGNIPEQFGRVLNSKQRKPDMSELVQLYFRGSLTSIDAVHARARELGVLNDAYTDEFVSLGYQYPTQTDLVRFMVRDVFDKTVVDTYRLDDEFPIKWTAEAQALGKAVGVNDTNMKLQWRAHWRIPSDTALYNMYHRLRPDRAEVVFWDTTVKPAIGADDADLFPKRPPVMTRDDLTYALKINDNLPTMVDRLTAISFRPITNTDAVRMYNAGFIGEDELISRYQDNGYNLADSKKLTDFDRAEKRKRTSNLSGVWTVRHVVQDYQQGNLSRLDADTLLAPMVLDPADRNVILQGADKEVEVFTRQKQVKSVKTRYVYGQIDDQGAEIDMKNYGVDPMRIPAILAQWSADKFGHAKEPRVTMVTQWYLAGVITIKQFADRLSNLGYGDDDASNIIKTAGVNQAQKMAAQAALAANKARKEAEKALRDAKQAIRTPIENMRDLALVDLDEAKAKEALAMADFKNWEVQHGQKL